MEGFNPGLLSLLGASLGLLGTAILFLDLRGDTVQDKVREIQIYIGRLQQQIDELAREPKPANSATLQGQSFGDIFDILRDGAQQANAKNTDLSLDLLEQVSREREKHRRAVGMSIVLILVGGILQLVAAQF